MMRAVVLLLSLLAAPAAWGRVTGEIVQWGEVELDRGPPQERGPGDQTLAPVRTTYGVRYVNRSDHIEAALCRSFAAHVMMSAGAGEGLPRVIEARIRHPAMTRPDGETSTEERFVSHATSGASNIAFTFDQPWEMQPGVWEIAFYADGEPVAAKAFTVTLPANGIRSICDGAPVS